MNEDAEFLIYKTLCGSDPDKLAALDAYVSLLAARDEEEGKAILDAQISAARAELRYQLGF